MSIAIVMAMEIPEIRFGLIHRMPAAAISVMMLSINSEISVGQR
jgi:hypothetical protein